MGHNVPTSKTSRGWPVGNHFSRPSESCFRAGQLKEILGLTKRNGIWEGKTYRGEGGRKLFSVGGLLVRFAPPPLF